MIPSFAIFRTAEPFRGQSGVYALIDPRFDLVLYVGQSVDIGRRYTEHCDLDAYGGNRAKRRWIKGLFKAGLLPELRVLAICDNQIDMDRLELIFIQIYRLNSQCQLNIADGGQRMRRRRPVIFPDQKSWPPA